MQKIIGIVLLLFGFYLLLRGHDLSRSITWRISNVISGGSAKVTFYYLGGAVSFLVGLLQIFRPGGK